MYYVLCPECFYIGFVGNDYSPLKASGKNKGAKLELVAPRAKPLMTRDVKELRI